MRQDGPIRVALLCDYREEHWPSMDLVAEMIQRHLESNHQGEVEVEAIVPRYHPRLIRLPIVGSKGIAKNFDRLANRMIDYPRFLRKLVREDRFDLFHLVDHSYSHLVHELPKGRRVVTCHDLDTFRCLLNPASEPRPSWFRAMTARIMKGLGDADAIACDSEATRDAILEHKIAPENRLSLVSLGSHSECTSVPNTVADQEATRMLGPKASDAVDLLHVGSNIARKRIDVLLDVFAEVRKSFPKARLIKIGGALPPELAMRAKSLGIDDAILVLPFFSPTISKNRDLLAAVYRRSSLVLQPSEAEGFGLPMIEALACGTPLLASDIKVLREVGGAGAVYRKVGDVAAWAEAACSILRAGPEDEAIRTRRQAGFEQARKFSWGEHVAQLVGIYRKTLEKMK